MLLLSDLATLNTAGRPVSAAIGMFDGVHRGHQHLLRDAIATARAESGLSLVITFDRHPASVVAPERMPALLQPLPARLAALAQEHPDALWLIPFDEAFSRQTGEGLHPWTVPVRRATATGMRGGRIFTLATSVPATRHGCASGEPNLASRSRPCPRCNWTVRRSAARGIRDTVRRGDFADAARLLGRPYELSGIVIRGDQLGRRLGFPTANLDTRGLVVPPHGVYATQVLVDGELRPGVTNLGLRPTLRETAPTLHVETHLFDFTGDLYGREVALRFVQKLRDEQRFGSMEDLRNQIQRDAESARRVLEAQAEC
jgi:riboflavin kinase/FMN adenylyltransferase